VIRFFALSLKRKSRRTAPAWNVTNGEAFGRVCAQSRDQVCDLQSTASTQPFIFSDFPLTEPEPL
jgi:hypothetical protein